MNLPARPTPTPRAVDALRAVVIDDDDATCQLIEHMLGRAGIEALAFDRGDEALHEIQRRAPHVVLTDLEMEGLSGLEVLERLSRSHPDIPVLVITGHADLDHAVGALRAGAYDFLTKPLDAKRVVPAVERAGRHQLLKAEVECGLLQIQLTELDLGGGPLPLTAGLLAALIPEFSSLPPETPIAIDLKPSLAPIVTGNFGPGGELADLRLWVRRGPRGWDPQHALAQGNLDLALLLGLRLARRWQGQITVATVASAAEEPSAVAFLDALCDLARFPAGVERVVFQGEEAKCVADAPPVDLSIFGFPGGTPDLGWAEGIKQVSRGSCLFVCGSGSESARA